MRLTPDEQAWLDVFRQALVERYPETIDHMMIYGSKARGDSHPDSDLDILLIVRNEAGLLRRALRRLGYDLAVTFNTVPSIVAYTQEEWERRKHSGSPFREAVERDAVSVL